MKSKLIVLFILTLFLIAACTPKQEITSFEDCVAAGNPVMESYPRQCRANGELFVEEIAAEKQFTECTERPEACTLQYDPVCALMDNGIRCVTAPCPSTDAVTMGNACSACGDENVLGYYQGACEDNRFVVCEDESFTGFNITEMAEQNGWICVDICPNNYDEYGTQIGSRECIQHYGEEEINEWQICNKSSDSCNCVKAYETTDDKQIENPEFRCVPDQYAERLLFRGGQTRLDENGQSSTAIA